MELKKKQDLRLYITFSISVNAHQRPSGNVTFHSDCLRTLKCFVGATLNVIRNRYYIRNRGFIYIK